MKTSTARRASPQEPLAARLRSIADACDGASKRLERAAREVSLPELSLLLSRYARRRLELAKEIDAQIERLPLAPRTSELQRAPARAERIEPSPRSRSLRTRARRDDAAILSECERGEGQLRALYEAALAGDLPGDLPMRLRRQSLAVVDAHDQLRELCAALAWCAVPMAV